jgi:hypothetical protein
MRKLLLIDRRYERVTVARSILRIKRALQQMAIPFPD